MKKKALIYGVTGQDGAYLSEFLLKKNYEVHGVKRRSSSINTDRIDHLYQDPHEANLKLILQCLLIMLCLQDYIFLDMKILLQISY